MSVHIFWLVEFKFAFELNCLFSFQNLKSFFFSLPPFLSLAQLCSKPSNQSPVLRPQLPLLRPRAPFLNPPCRSHKQPTSLCSPKLEVSQRSSDSSVCGPTQPNPLQPARPGRAQTTTEVVAVTATPPPPAILPFCAKPTSGRAPIKG
jgi:hypothetical protein